MDDVSGCEVPQHHSHGSCEREHSTQRTGPSRCLAATEALLKVLFEVPSPPALLVNFYSQASSVMTTQPERESIRTVRPTVASPLIKRPNVTFPRMSTG